MDSDSIWKLRNGKVQRVETWLAIALKFNIIEQRGKKATILNDNIYTRAKQKVTFFKTLIGVFS